MSKLSHRNHYIPEFYLRSFVESKSNLLFRYYKTHSQKVVEDKVTPKMTGYLIDANVFNSKEHTNRYPADILETHGYSHIDSKAAQSYVKQLAGYKLTDEERFNWAFFLNSIFHRNPKKILFVDDLARKGYKNAVQDLYNSVTKSQHPNPKGFIDSVVESYSFEAAIDTAKIAHFHTMQNDNFTNEIKNALWITTKIFSSEILLTSDYPILSLKDPKSNRILTLQIALTPKCLQTIYFFNDITDESHRKLSAELIKIHNILQIREKPNFIYSAFKLDDSSEIKYQKAMDLFLPITNAKNPV